MNVLALAAALVFAQAPAAPEAAAERPTAEPATVPAAPAPSAAPRASIPESAERERAADPSLVPAMATTTARRRRSAPSPDPAFSSTSTTTTTSTSGRVPGPTRPLPEHEEAERAARGFLEALARGDAVALAAAASDRFSFDGDVQSGREAIRRTWRDLFAARASGTVPAVGSLEILPALDAAVRFGKPPIRLAPLVRSGVLVAVGDVGGRTVVLFVAREGGRMAILGMHD